MARRVGVDLGVVALYVALAALAARFALLDGVPVWYPPAGLAMAAGALRGWRALPALVVGELLAGALLLGGLDGLGWLLVPDALAFATVHTLGGRVMATFGALAPTISWRRPVRILVVGIGLAPLAAGLARVAVRSLAGVVTVGDVARTVLVSALGDAGGAAAVGLTIVTIVVRSRRGGRWWAIPGMSTTTSALAILSPALLVGALAVVSDGVVAFAAVVLAPFLAVCVVGGVPAAGLAALPTSVTVTVVASGALAEDPLALTELQLLQLAVIATGLFVAMVVEERRDLELRLAESTRHLRTAQVQSRSGSFTWDVHDGDVTWSQGLFHLVGIPEGPTDETTYLGHVHPDDRDGLVARLRAAIEAGEAYEATHRMVTADGEQRTVRASVEPRVFDGRVVEVVGTLTDVTAEDDARRQLEGALAREHAAAEAERTARAVEARAAAVTEHAERVEEVLLIAVSHEIRTPLTVVRGIVDTLARPELAEDPAARTFLLDRLDGHTRRLERVLTDLLDVDRVRRGVVQPNRRTTHLRDLIEPLVDLVDLDRDRVDVVVADEVEQFPLDAAITARIVEHLLLNTRRHAPDASVTVSAVATGTGLELRVEDEGPGIPPEERNRLFEAFSSGDHSRDNPGTGVGLYLVQRFAALQGGSVAIDDRDGGGTTVRVTLPRHLGDDTCPDHPARSRPAAQHAQQLVDP